MNDFQKNINLLNDYYDKIYLVIIERNIPERLEKIKTSLKGLNFEIFKGIDGKLLSEKEKNEIYDHENSVKMMSDFFQFQYHRKVLEGLKIGNIGCSQSHLNIYKDMIQKGYKKILVLEDDARLIEKNICLIPKIFEQMPADTDLFYWGYRWHDCESSISRFKRKFIIPFFILFSGKNVKKVKDENKIKYPNKFKKNIWHSGFHAGTHAYAINIETAKKVSELNTPIKFAPDAALSYLVRYKKIKAYVAVPLIFREDQTLVSSIFY